MRTPSGEADFPSGRVDSPPGLQNRPTPEMAIGKKGSVPGCQLFPGYVAKQTQSILVVGTPLQRVSCMRNHMQSSVALLPLFRRLAAHAFDRLGLAGDADIRACDLPGVALAGDAAVGPLRAPRRLRLGRRMVRRHGQPRRRVRYDIGRRQSLAGRAIRTRRRRFGGAARKRRHEHRDHERAPTRAGITNRKREQHHDRFASSKATTPCLASRAISSSGSPKNSRRISAVSAPSRCG